MSKHMEFYIQNDAASIQIGENVYRRVSIPIDDFNAACDHYGFVKERTCRVVEYAEAPILVCSECGAVQPDDYAVYYCWSCGAKVVK